MVAFDVVHVALTAESEHVSVVFVHKGQVEYHADEVTLNMVVGIIFVAVSDTMGSVFAVLCDWRILEHQLVFGVLEDVIGVDTLNETLGWCHIFSLIILDTAFHELFEKVIQIFLFRFVTFVDLEYLFRYDLHFQSFGAILFLQDSPITILWG